MKILVNLIVALTLFGVCAPVCAIPPSNYLTPRRRFIVYNRDHHPFTDDARYAIYHRTTDSLQHGVWPGEMCEGQPTNPSIPLTVCEYYGTLPTYNNSNLWTVSPYGQRSTDPQLSQLAFVVQFQCEGDGGNMRFVLCPALEVPE